MKVFYSDHHPLPLPPKHRFPESKYRRLREFVTELSIDLPIDLSPAPQATLDELSRVHSDRYLAHVVSGTLSELDQRRIGFPWSEQLVVRCRHSTGGTLAASNWAMHEGLAIHLAGGTHHAFADAGQGFCVFNDVAVAVRNLRAQGMIRRAVVIDCDVHQGNGTAEIFQEDPDTFTFSMHGDRNFPFRKASSDLDIALPDRCADELYLARLSDAINNHLPLKHADCVFYLAGADPYVGDRFGRLSLTKHGLAKRDEIVLAVCRALELPVVVVMAGGYAPNIEDIAEIQARTVEQAIKIRLSSPAELRD